MATSLRGRYKRRKAAQTLRAEQYAQYVADIEKQLRDKSREIIKGSEILTLLQEAKELIHFLALPESELRNDMQLIQQQLTRIEANTTKTTAAVKSYAAVASAGSSRNDSNTTATRNSVMEQQRQLEEIKRRKSVLIKFRNDAEKVGIKALSNKALMDRIKTIEEKTGDVLAVRRLPSGDLELLACKMEAKARMEMDQQLHKGLADSAYVVRRTFAVLAHGVRVDSVDTVNAQATIKSLEKQNEQLHPGLQICRIAWTKRAVSEAKIHSSLIVEVATAETANRLIKEGLLQDYSHRICEYFDKNCRLKQCFHCQKYGHTGTACKNALRCAGCAQGHRSQACKAPADRRKCAVCGGNHPAWSHLCPVRKEEKERLNGIWKNRPTWHVETEPVVLPRQSQTVERRNNAGDTTSHTPAPTRHQAVRERSRSPTPEAEEPNEFTQDGSTIMSIDINTVTNSFPALPSTHGKRAHSQGPGESSSPSPTRRRASMSVVPDSQPASSSHRSDSALALLRYPMPPPAPKAHSQTQPQPKPKRGRPPLHRISGKVSRNTQ